MSSTDGGDSKKNAAAESTRAIRRFFDDELMPVAAKLRTGGKAAFPTGADRSQATYWVRRTRTTASPADFEVAGTGSIDEFEPALSRMWADGGWPELVPLAATLSGIARSVYFVEDRDDEVSPFMYVMF